MSNVKSKASHRLLVALLSIAMVFSMIPFSIVANAATTEHPDAVTITVLDEEGQAIKDASVAITVNSVSNGDAYISETKTTDEYGVVEVLASDSFVENDLTISAIVSANGYSEGTLSETSILTGEDNFDVSLVSTAIKDVEISGKTLTYTGSSQELVSVTEVEGDTVEYYLNGATDPVTEVPTATDAATYSVRVVVTRTGYTTLDKTVETVISPADIEGIDIAPVTGLKYNESNQALVTLTGSFANEDTVTWTVNGTDEASNTIPERMAVGSYTVKLTVDRGANYNKFEKTVSVDIALGEIDLGDLKIEANDRTYDTTEQPLLTVTKGGDYTLEYSDDNQTSWVKDTIPVATNAGEYVIYVKATKEGYNDKNTPAFPITVTISKATQSLEFADSAPSEVTLGTNNEYDFVATGENLSGNNVEYSLVDGSSADVATITTDGKVTVTKAGIVTVKAFRAGNENYLDAVVYKTIVVKNASNELVSFDTDSVNYVLDEEGVVSEKTASKANSDDNGALVYSIDKTNIGLTLNTTNGKLTVDDEWKLIQAMNRNSGSVMVTVTVNKTEGSLDGIEWLFADNSWKSQNINEKVYATDSDTYTIVITYAEATSFDEVCKIEASDPVSGWYNAEYPATITPLDATKYTIALDEAHWTAFGDSVTIVDQGNDTHYVYLKDKTTGQISAPIAVSVNVDTVNPSNLGITFSDLNLIEKLGQSLGFYNPTVTITFTAEDVTSGIDHFDWTYTPESGDPVTKEIAVTVDGNKATATLTLPADEAEQMHGKISFTATDKANNVIGKDDDYVFIVDTIAPELSVKYQGEESYTAQEDIHNGAHFFNSDVVVELTITETNFYAEDVVKVSKDGGAATAVTPSWDGKVGTFTLAGDGDYVVYVTYTDKANNKMADYASETITVDKTAPVVKIDYVHNGDVQKTIFTVTEHNFRASDVVITGTMKDIKGDDVAFTAAQLTEILNNATWTPAGDVYTYEYDQYVNGIYNLKMDYKDIAGWDATQFVADEFIIDHGAPTDIKIEYAKTPLDTFLEVITLGFYNPSVTVRFTAYDTSAVVESFTWGYTKETGASIINHPETLADATVPAVQDQNDKTKFTAEITLTAEEVAQYRGYLSVLATDAFQNKSVKKVDNGNIIVVDTIAPEISVEYTEADRVIGTDYYYNNALEVKFTVTEANFYAEDVVVTVTKNGEAFNYGTVTWGTRDAEDKTIGTFTLPAPADHSGDGHYVITVEYTDRSNNKMVKYVSDTHTIDTTLPVINVEYQNKAVANKLTDRDGNEREYFADTQTAVITINEHNFISDEVEFTIIAKDVTGAELDAATLNSKTTWSVDSTGDIHTITITYPGDANYTFDVAYTDKATNAAEDYATDYFTVDKTAPTNLKVEYSTSVLDTVLESLSFGFYNAKMTVTLTADDPTSEVHSFLYSYLNADGVSNVNAELINEAIQAADIKYSEDKKTATVTFEIPKMVLGNDNQFNGTVEFTATDRAGNTTDVHKVTKRIVVDNIAPTAQVSYNEATNVVGDISYYNGNINATVTINEANFYANDVQVMVSKDGGAATAVTPTWTNNSVDVHVGTFTITGDGDYIVTINYTDKSSNQMTTYTSKQMTIDTEIEDPTYTINDVAKTEVGGAYKGDVTIGFNFADQNFDTKTIKLTRTRFDKVEDVTDTFVKVSDNDKGGSGSFTIPSEVGNDGIYVLTIGITDKAKHTTESEIKFTVNRFGSVYEYSDELVTLIKDGGQYITSVEDDLVITEYNADRILEGSLKILITRDGETVDVEFASDPENINGEVGIGESGWYQYVYTIKASNFEQDGVYKISLTSAYAADDSANNESTSVPENSIDEDGNEILDTMNFTVDSVAPEIRNIVNLDKAIADVDKIVDGKLNVKYTIVDVGGLKTIEIIVNGETVQTLTEEDIADNAYNFSGSFDIAEQDGTTAQKVRIVVTDLAGNVTDTDSDDFLKAHSEDNEDSTYVFFNKVTVSRNFFVRWYANTGLFWGSIAGVVVLAGAIWFLIAFKRKKKEEK